VFCSTKITRLLRDQILLQLLRKLAGGGCGIECGDESEPCGTAAVFTRSLSEVRKFDPCLEKW
jgi:hypothetical protein